MATTKDTRVKVPVDTRTPTGTHPKRARARGDPMTPGASSPSGNSPRSIRGSASGNIPTTNMQMPMNIATCTVLTMSHPGYQKAVAYELLRYYVKIVGITEARIPESRVDLLEHHTVYPTQTARDTLERLRHQHHGLREHGSLRHQKHLRRKASLPLWPYQETPSDVPARMALKLSIDVCSGTKPSPDWNRPRGRTRNTSVNQLVADSWIAARELWKKAGNRNYWVALRPRAGSGEWWWWYIHIVYA